RDRQQGDPNAEEWAAAFHHELVNIYPINDLMPALRPALRQPSQTPETPRTWQPMITVPRDGTPVLIFVPGRYRGNGGISWGCVVAGEWLDARAMRISESDISHWMPLPQAPEGGTK